MYISITTAGQYVCLMDDTQIDRDQLIFILVYHLTDQG